MKKLSSFLSILLAILLPFGARGVVVTSTADDGAGSLRQAIAIGGTITFSSLFNSPQTIHLVTALSIEKNLQIMGPGPGLLALDGGGAVQVFFVVDPVLNAGIHPDNVELSGLTITNGFSFGSGAGALHTFGVLTISRCVIVGNTALADGAGIYSSGAALNILDSVIASNTGNQGGGLYLAGGALLLERSTVSRNLAGNGGGLYVASAQATIVNSTLALNAAITSGGGLFNGGTSSLYQCTVAGNSAQVGGGIWCAIGRTVDFAGTILAENDGENFSGTGGRSLGYNLSDPFMSSGFLNQPGDQIVPSAGLDPNGLQNNGGPTLTIALLRSSLAIDAGDPGLGCNPAPCYDQRGVGFPRVQGGRIDIGAFEFAQRLAKADVRDDLVTLRNSATSDLSKFNAAINYLNKSLDPADWLDDSRPKRGKDGESVFTNEKAAVTQVLGLQTKYPALIGLINRLVAVDRGLAVISINDAVAKNGNAAKISAARAYLSKGDTDVAAGKPTYAIDDYKNAWKSATSAVP